MIGYTATVEKVDTNGKPFLRGIGERPDGAGASGFYWDTAFLAVVPALPFKVGDRVACSNSLVRSERGYTGTVTTVYADGGVMVAIDGQTRTLIYGPNSVVLLPPVEPVEPATPDTLLAIAVEATKAYLLAANEATMTNFTESLTASLV